MHEFCISYDHNYTLTLSGSGTLTPDLIKKLQRGSVLADYTICGVNGAPGVGKTSLWHYVCNLTPPATHTSTACIEQAKRIVIEVGEDGVVMRIVYPEDMIDMVAEGMSAEVVMREEQSAAMAGEDVAALSLMGHMTLDESEPKSESHKTTDATVSTSQPVSTSSTSQNVASLTQKSSSSKMEILPQTSEIVKKMVRMRSYKQVLQTHFLLFIDCGGQPQYHDLIPLLLQNLSLQLALTRLPERLDDTPQATYHKGDGSCFELGHFNETNLELIAQAVARAQCQSSHLSSPLVEKQPEHLKCMVIGTFRDKAGECSESLADKNKKLSDALQPFNKYIIRRSKDEMMYAINTLQSGPGRPRDPVSDELRRSIATCGQSMRVRYPLSDYLFELELRRAGRVLSRAQCWVIAQQLMMESKQVMDTALQFFHSAHLMLYYKDVLEDVVFVDPMAVFDWITAILEKSIEIKEAVEQEVETVDLLRLKHQALVPTSFLESLQSEVTGEDSVLVNVDDFINLLKHLMIFATVEEDDKSTNYFMPSILDYREGKDIVRPISETAPYLVIKFAIKTVPSAVLSSLEVYLRSCEGNIQWQIPVHHSEEIVPLYKNDMHFTATLSGGIGGGFTLVGLSTHYEVHADSKCSPELLPLIWEDIQHGIDYICNRFSFDLPYSIGFRCLCERTDIHPAIPSVDSKSWVCSEDETVTGTLSDKQKLWLRNESQSKLKGLFFNESTTV